MKEGYAKLQVRASQNLSCMDWRCLIRTCVILNMFRHNLYVIAERGQEEALRVLLSASSNAQFRETADKNGASLVLANFRSETRNHTCAFVFGRFFQIISLATRFHVYVFISYAFKEHLSPIGSLCIDT